MGIIALLLFVAGLNPGMEIPFWVKSISILALAGGVSMGGKKIIKTVGYGIFKVRPLHSLESQLGAAVLLLGCNLAGAPVSTTQIISSSVMGVGAGIRAKGVRWNIARTIFWSWLFTIPLAGLISLAIFLGLQRVI